MALSYGDFPFATTDMKTDRERRKIVDTGRKNSSHQSKYFFLSSDLIVLLITY